MFFTHRKLIQMRIQANDSLNVALDFFRNVGHEEVGAVTHSQLSILATLHCAGTVTHFINHLKYLILSHTYHLIGITLELYDYRKYSKMGWLEISRSNWSRCIIIIIISPLLPTLSLTIYLYHALYPLRHPLLTRFPWSRYYL